MFSGEGSEEEAVALALTRAENSSSKISSPVSCFCTFFLLLSGEISTSNTPKSRPALVVDVPLVVTDDSADFNSALLDGKSSGGRRESNAELAFDFDDAAALLEGGAVGKMTAEEEGREGGGTE